METTRQNKNSPPAPKGVERHLPVTDQINARHTDFSQRRTHQSRYERGTRLPQRFSPSERSEEIIKNVNANMKSIRFELGTRVRHQLRIIPELKFFVDDSLDYLERIDELLK